MIERYNSRGDLVPNAGLPEKYRAEVSDTMHDIGEVIDHGNVPDWDKDELDGQIVTVVGIIGPEEWQMGNVHFVLLYRENDDVALDAWGIMFPSDSPLVGQCLAMARQGFLPFRTGIQKVASQANKGYHYWVAFKPGQPRLPAPERAGKK